LSESWKGLSEEEKKVYQDAYEDEKKKYEAEVKIYVSSG
jgi:hypothetical protein